MKKQVDYKKLFSLLNWNCYEGESYEQALERMNIKHEIGRAHV